MKKSTTIALGFFSLAIILETISLNIDIKDIRLFVGVFIVLGLAFMTYSIKEDANLKGNLLFEGKEICNAKLIRTNQGEYYLKANTEYLWVENSIFLKWHDRTKFEHILTGLAAAIAGVKNVDTNSEYLTFKLEQDSYTNVKSLEELLKSSHFKVIEKGKTITLCSKYTYFGKRLFKVITSIMIASLLAYMILQII